MKSLKQFSFFTSLIILTLLLTGYQFGRKDNLKMPHDIVPCELLTDEQVETVLPGHDVGFTAHSGGSLMKGVDSYQCSYSNDKLDLFMVIVHVAADKEKFDWIKPGSSSEGTELKIGDGGRLIIDNDELKLEASKGLKVIELDLMTSDAVKYSDALIKIASILMDKI
jgi:hypothetical protein